MREAKGEYMTFLDSDDWLEDDAVEILLDAQMKHPDKLIFAHYYRVQTDGTKTIANPKISQDAFLDIHDVALDYCGVKSAGAGAHSSCAKIYSSDVIANSIDFPEGIAYSEDAVFVIKYLYRVNGIYFVNKPVYDVFSRSGSAIRSSYRPVMLQSQIDAYDILINLPENTPEIKKLMSISRTVFLMTYITWAFTRYMNGIGEKEIAEIRNFVRPYAYEFLSFQSISFRRKISFLVGMYAPLWLGYGIFFCWNIVKGIIDRK